MSCGLCVYMSLCMFFCRMKIGNEPEVITYVKIEWQIVSCPKPTLANEWNNKSDISMWLFFTIKSVSLQLYLCEIKLLFFMMRWSSPSSTRSNTLGWTSSVLPHWHHNLWGSHIALLGRFATTGNQSYLTPIPLQCSSLSSKATYINMIVFEFSERRPKPWPRYTSSS